MSTGTTDSARYRVQLLVVLVLVGLITVANGLLRLDDVFGVVLVAGGVSILVGAVLKYRRAGS